MPHNAVHQKLRDVLAYLWPDVRECRRLVADAHINASHIDWNDPSALRWQSIIDEAEKQNVVSSLVPVLLNEYPQNAQLRDACAEWMAAIRTRKIEPVDSYDFLALKAIGV